MKNEKPILFNAEMVKAILEGRKTMTRRPMKVQPSRESFDKIHTLMSTTSSENQKHVGKHHWGNGSCLDPKNDDVYFSNPFGDVGDRLWVREPTKVLDHQWRAISGIWARAIKAEYSDGAVSDWFHRPDRLAPVAVGKGMPNGCFREASRITLEITDIRVERVQDISEEDAVAEGAPPDTPSFSEGKSCFPRSWFCGLWDSIYKNWNDNPWTWIIEFRVVEAGVK